MSGHGNIAHVITNAPDFYPVNVGSTDAWLEFTCGICGTAINGAVIATARDLPVKWIRCVKCQFGSVVNGSVQSPAPERGESVDGLPDGIGAVYGEARRCLGVAAYSAVDLLCRKLLMHVAMDKGAARSLTFGQYLDHLQQIGYITPPLMPWVDHIRKRGNLATHELPTPSEDEAEDTLAFTAQMLRLVYEMEFRRSRYLAPIIAKENEPGEGAPQARS
ncbi:MAG: DUF4145 domain-containing protein [Cellulomonas sp.]|uniref:DUF4145 domain-containing protein n=1 Tax=Cellulomonas sp. TaxID=40001 RepID=UPI0017BA0C8A|nr:DUF4145 domain-containing protein [Cellulomonas sp.]NMM31415.1 DUF4145 domain-containing protein [Cellulomonas sp.]